MSSYHDGNNTVPYHRFNSTGHDRRRKRSRRFSILTSTEAHFATDETRCYGNYAEIRKRLDYDYHCRYRKERQWLHDGIIEHFLESEASDLCWLKPKDPWLILTVGPPGAGKRYSIDHLIRLGRMPLLSYIFVDPDEIRRMLPEYELFVERVPEKVDELTKKEAGYIAETMVHATLNDGRNVFFDGCLQDADWYCKFLDALKEQRPGLRIGIIHVAAERSIILDRIHMRAKETGREISEEDLDRMLDSIPSCLEKVRPYVEMIWQIRNDDEPELVGSNWVEFSMFFTQQSAFSRPKNGIPRQISLEDYPSPMDLRRRSILQSRRRFSVLVSSEENHQMKELDFIGPYAHIRKTLDYSYHKNYTFDRQRFQDAIISELLRHAVVEDQDGNICTTPTEPWIVFTAGAMGAGKSYTMKRLVDQGRFPLIAFINVDPDGIRRQLPEFHLYVSSNPELAGELTRKEAGFISEILTLAALETGKNVLVDGSLRDHDWYKSYFARLREGFPSLRLAILHVTAPREAIFQRAAERAIMTGRVVPREVLESAFEQVPISVAVLKDYVDYHVELENAPDTPDIRLVTPGVTWESFTANWAQ